MIVLTDVPMECVFKMKNKRGRVEAVSGPSVAEPVAEVTSEPVKKSRWWIWLIVVLVLIGVGVGAWFLLGGDGGVLGLDVAGLGAAVGCGATLDDGGASLASGTAVQPPYRWSGGLYCDIDVGVA